MSFYYLGSHVHWTLPDEFDVQHRISAASAAFGALSSTLCSRRVNSTLRGQIYSTLVCSILLYGSECWALSQALVQQLQAFHNKCVRRMCFVTLQHCHLHRISAATLDAHLKLTGIQTTIDSLRLGWAGHVARMDHSLVCHGAFLPHGYVQNAQSADLASPQHIVSMILSIVLILTPRIGFTLLTIEMNGGSSAELSSPKLRREAAVQLQFQPHLQLCLNLCCLLHHCHNANAVPPHDCSQPCKHDLYRMQAPCLLRKHRKQRPQPCFKGSNRHYTSQILKS